MAKKLYDLAVKTGEYTNKDGETKGRWQNVGAVIQGDDGGKFIMLERWFNPAGIPNPEDRSTVLLSMFKPEEKQPAPAKEQKKADGYRPADDDIPF